MNLKFSGQGLRFLAYYMAIHDIRYYLKGIYVRPLPPEAGGGVLGAATNGHILGMWHDKDGHAERPAILDVSKELLRQVGRARRGIWPTLQLIDGRLAAVHDEQEIYLQPNTKARETDPAAGFEVQGKFPVVETVIPDLAAQLLGTDAWLNAAYMKTVSGSLSEIGERRGFSAITMRHVKKDGAVLVTSATHPQALAVIMPLREQPADPVPDWARRVVTAHKKAATNPAKLMAGNVTATEGQSPVPA